jgi:predicted phosphodiesterase
MRYGVLSDVHGNLAALDSTVRHLSSVGVDAWLCAGDLVGYGPQPNECVEAVAGLGARCVVGNHELALLGRLPEERVGALARSTLSWTRDVLREDVRTFLAGLPLTAETDGVVVAHGSLTDATEYVGSWPLAATQLRRLARDRPDARVLVLGHTHRARTYGEQRGRLAGRGAVPLDPPERYLVNPGSVGQSRQWERRPRARAMILDLDRWRAEFYALDYDVETTLAALRQHGFPRTCVHHPRNLVRSAVRRAARLLGARAAGRRASRTGAAR